MENRKPTGKKGYGSIPHLPGSRTGPSDRHISESQAAIATEKTRDGFDLVICQEKLDGSNCSVAMQDGKIYALSRKGYECNTSPYRQHHIFERWVQQNEERFRAVIKEGERICGEWLIQACGTKYDLPHEPYVPFDIIEGDTRLSYHEFLKRVLPMSFTVPNLLHMGGAFSIRQALKAIESGGKHGALESVEGAVWRVERRGRVEFLCKYVRHEKEDGKYLDTEIWNTFTGNQPEIPDSSTFKSEI